MATWGEFIADIQVLRIKPHGMVVPVEQVMELWEERNRLRTEAARLQQELEQEREGCAREIEEFAEACEAEGEESAFIASALRAAANLLRDRGQTPEEEPALSEAEPIPEGPPATELSEKERDSN